MRVLYFHQHFGTPAGSTGTRSYEFARALLAQGHQVTMVCGSYAASGMQLPFDERRKWHRGLVDGIDVISLPLPYSNRDGLARRAVIFLEFAFRSTWVALRSECDVVFATSTPLTAAMPGIASRMLLQRKRWVFEVRDLWPELPRALGMTNPFALGSMSLLEWLAYNTADACIGLSPGIVDGIRRRAPQNREVVMIPNGCDTKLFHPRLRAPLDLPGVAEGDFVAGFTGAHGVANGLDAVLDAATVLKQRGRTDIKFVLVGDGNQKDRLVARAAGERLTNVLFFSPIKKAEIARVTASFDCGLMVLKNVPAFYYGTSPNKFFDYISAGIPVVNNYPGWLTDLIREHECGVSVPPENPAAFADALERLAADRRESRRLGTNGRALAEREFSRERLADRFVRFLTDKV